jgi:dTMP kinase
MQGVFITVEGVEGSGKTTVVQAVADRLRQAGVPVVVTAEPGGTPLGAHVRAWLLQGGHRSGWAEAFLFLASRAEHVAQVIRPALQRGDVVLCDRYTDSTLAYQGFGLGLPLKGLRTLNALATGDLQPHLTLLLDLDPVIGLQRVARTTAFERRDLAFHRRVRAGYLQLAQEEPHRIKVVDAHRSLDEVLQTCIALVSEAIHRWQPSLLATGTQ